MSLVTNNPAGANGGLGLFLYARDWYQMISPSYAILLSEVASHEMNHLDLHSQSSSRYRSHSRHWPIHKSATLSEGKEARTNKISQPNIVNYLRGTPTFTPSPLLPIVLITHTSVFLSISLSKAKTSQSGIPHPFPLETSKEDPSARNAKDTKAKEEKTRLPDMLPCTFVPPHFNSSNLNSAP